MLTRSLTVALAVAFFAGIAPGAPIGAASSVCDRFSPGEREGHIQDVTLDEVSGVVASRQHPGVLWAHNDSGHEPKIYGVTRTGESVGTYEIAGAENIDWEDISIGPGPSRDVSYLYVGDIGANFRERHTVTVYRFPEPTAVRGLRARSGSTVVVRTYHDVLAFSRPNGRPLAAAFETPPCRAGGR